VQSAAALPAGPAQTIPAP